jgi:hypothetical protein
VHVNSLVDKVAIWPATAAQEPASAIVLAEEASATGPEERVLATGQAEAERIALGAETFPAAAVETVTPSEEGQEDSTGRMLVPGAAAAPPVWGREVEAEVSVVVAVADGEGRSSRLQNWNHWSIK